MQNNKIIYVKAEMYNYKYWLKGTDEKEIPTFCERLLKNSGFTIINFMEHHFYPYGYTCIWLLGESHLAVHTFPEEDRTYLELTSCNRNMYMKFIRGFHVFADSALQD